MFNVRKGGVNDLEQLAVLFDLYRVFYNKTSAPAEAKAFLADRIQQNESHIFVAENETGLIAFVQLYPLFSSTRMKRLWLLNDLFVHEDFTRAGVSVALIDACKQLCRDTNSCGMILETAKDNIPANRLYLKTGFVADGAHNYYEWENTAAIKLTT